MKVWRSFQSTTEASLWYLLIVVVVPVLSLLAFGLWHLFERSWLLPVLGIWLLTTAGAYGIFRWQLAGRENRLHEKLQNQDSLPEMVPKPADWSDREESVWESAKRSIEIDLLNNPEWEKLPQLALAQVSAVSTLYHEGDEQALYRFTLPEALLLATVASERYRQLVLSNVPFADSITIATLLSLRDEQHSMRRGVKWLSRARRVLRLSNPASAAMSEIRDQFTDRVFTHVSISLQTDLKRLALQEIAQVAIDLYSGRLKVSEAELASFATAVSQSDAERQAQPVEPLRVVLIGQSGAGKSSLINALVDDMAAEVDVLPSTDETTVHAVQLSGEDDESILIHLVDTVGLDGSAKRYSSVVEQSLEADLIVFVSRANQPAREPDKQCLDAVHEAYANNVSRKQAPLLLAVTHVDALPPKVDWTPPYDLEGDSEKGRTIKLALDSICRQLGLNGDTPIVPVCTSKERGRYNVDVIAHELVALADSAANTQLNRRRVERATQSPSLVERWQQVRGFGRVLGESVVTSVKRWR